MYVLIVLMLSGQAPMELKTQEFESIVSCMQAVEKLVGMENKSIKFKAVCTKK